MSRIEFTGSLQKDIDKFAEHDEALLAILRRIATNNIGELNKSWSDEVSKQKLNAFNDSLLQVKAKLDSCHEEMNRYFSEVQAILNGNELLFPKFGSIDTDVVYATAGDGTLFDIDQVNNILSSLNNEIREACDLIDYFDPNPDSLNGSSEDVYNAVKSNFKAAASLYKVVEEPLMDISNTISEVKSTYEQKAKTITNATAA